MLAGMKERLLADYKVRIMQLRDKEMQLIVSQANGASIIFALLTGIMADAMWTGYYMYAIREVGGTYREHDNQAWSTWFELVVCLSVYTSIFLPVLGLWTCMLLTLLGPRRALNGPPESFNETVDSMMEEFAAIPKMLAMCIFSVFGTMATWSWATWQEGSKVEGPLTSGKTAALTVTAMSVLGGTSVYLVFLWTRRRFDIARGHAISAKWGTRAWERAPSPTGLRRFFAGAKAASRLPESPYESQPNACWTLSDAKSHMRHQSRAISDSPLSATPPCRRQRVPQIP